MPAHLPKGGLGVTQTSPLPALRAAFRALFGLDTTSNNRQWLLRRLALLPGCTPFPPYPGDPPQAPARAPKAKKK